MSWRVAAASAIGTSHVRTGGPCQDSLGVKLFDTAEGSVILSVVSDGAGSAACSDVGSKTAIDETTRLLQEFFSSGGRASEIQREAAEGWLNEVRKAIESIAAQSDTTSREYACTLLVAIIGEQSATFFQVGDGAIVFENDNNAGWSYVFWPQHGEYVNSTNFITASDSSTAMEFAKIERQINNFAAFSDGIESLVMHYATKSVHAPFFKAMLSPVQNLQSNGIDAALSESLAKYLSSDQVCERTDDDKTLILASRHNPTPTDVYA